MPAADRLPGGPVPGGRVGTLPPVGRIAVIAKLTARPGARDQLLAALEPLVGHARDGEEGTLVYIPHTEAEDPDAVWFYELYRDAEALGAHRSSPVMREVGAALAGLLAGPPEIHVLSPRPGAGFDR